jgi:hypothetical protein
MMLLCKPAGRGNWRTIVIALNVPLDLFRFQRGQRFTWGQPAQTLRIVEVHP